MPVRLSVLAVPDLALMWLSPSGVLFSAIAVLHSGRVTFVRDNCCGVDLISNATSNEIFEGSDSYPQCHI